MASERTACISFSGITIRFRFPTPVVLSEPFLALQCADPGTADEEIEICLLDTPLCPGSEPVHTGTGITIYPVKEGWLRIYPPLTAKDGCQVACLLRPNGKHTLYYPTCRWDFYASPLRCFHLIGGEVLLLRHNAFLLHSSLVRYNGKMILFSGPPCAGKSTQAELWRRYLGAEIINGDRCVIMERDGLFYGGGSPWAGTSGLYRPDQAPIAGILLVNKAPENRLDRLGFSAFAPLFTQTIVNSWDPEFMKQVCGLFEKLLAQVPVYRLNCRPDEEAVELVRRTLF